MSDPEPQVPRVPSAAAADALAALEAMLDAQALARLRELDPGDRNGLLLRVLCTFDGSLQRLLAQTLRAREADDREALRQVAHTLKSSSASMGALTLSGLCARIEAEARQSPQPALAPLLDAMVAECEALLGALAPLCR